jgi:hypothetical protein
MKLLAARRLALRLGVVAALAWLFAARAEAQNIELKPTYGSVKLKSGFRPDPFSRDVVAGGAIKTTLGGVRAYVANAPDFKLYYEAGDFVLTIYVRSKADTTLLINTADGKWVADDDGGGFPNPLIRFRRPKTGRYDIYVGTVGPDTAPATLYITELKITKVNP